MKTTIKTSGKIKAKKSTLGSRNGAESAFYKEGIRLTCSRFRQKKIRKPEHGDHKLHAPPEGNCRLTSTLTQRFPPSRQCDATIFVYPEVHSSDTTRFYLIRCWWNLKGKTPFSRITGGNFRVFRRIPAKTKLIAPAKDSRLSYTGKLSLQGNNYKVSWLIFSNNTRSTRFKFSTWKLASP